MPTAIRNVVLIVEERQELRRGARRSRVRVRGAPSFALLRRRRHAEPARARAPLRARRQPLRRRRASGAGQQVVAAGIATRVHRAHGAVRDARRPLGSSTRIPRTTPRAGYVFHALARHDLSFRDYGGFARRRRVRRRRRAATAATQTFPRRRSSTVTSTCAIRRWNSAARDERARRRVRARLRRARRRAPAPRFALRRAARGGPRRTARRSPTATARSARSSRFSRTCRRGARPRSSSCRPTRAAGATTSTRTAPSRW